MQYLCGEMIPCRQDSHSVRHPNAADSASHSLSIRRLLSPHAKGLTIGIAAVIVEGVASLAEPWPLKIVLDNVLKSKSGHGWLNQLILSAAGTDKVAILKFAALAVLVIAAIGAICSYTEKYITTNLGQWVMHDLRTSSTLTSSAFRSVSTTGNRPAT